MDTVVYKDAEQALKIAKITLMMQKNTVCYTTTVFSLKQIFTIDVPTAGTDGRTLLLNPDFFLGLTPAERLTLLAHEALHVLFDHMHRIGDRVFKLWNIAGDYVINGALHNANYTPLKGWLHNTDYDGKNTEQVYAILDKKTDAQKQAIYNKCGADTINGNDVNYPDPNDPDAVSQDDVTSIILRATTQAKAMGQEPGSLPLEIDIGLQKRLNPPLPWQIILQNYLNNFKKEDYSFRKPNKRFCPQHYLPTAYSEAICDIAVMVDISSSVTDDEFNSFITKIHEIKTVMKPDKMTVVSFNTKITAIQELNEFDDPFTKLKFKGRGGTAISPVHKWAAESKPTFMIVFTDGEFDQYEPEDKSIPIIWLIHNCPSWKSQWGKVIHYNLT